MSTFSVLKHCGNGRWNSHAGLAHFCDGCLPRNARASSPHHLHRRSRSRRAVLGDLDTQRLPVRYQGVNGFIDQLDAGFENGCPGADNEIGTGR